MVVLKSVFFFQSVFNSKQTEYLTSSEGNDSCKRETIWLERDLIFPLAGTNTAFLYQTTNWWSQIKTAGSAIYANRHYLALYNKTNAGRLTKEVLFFSKETFLSSPVTKF